MGFRAPYKGPVLATWRAGSSCNCAEAGPGMSACVEVAGAWALPTIVGGQPLP